MFTNARQKKEARDRVVKLLKVLGDDLSEYCTVPIEELTTKEVTAMATLLVKEINGRRYSK